VSCDSRRAQRAALVRAAKAEPGADAGPGADHCAARQHGHSTSPDAWLRWPSRIPERGGSGDDQAPRMVALLQVFTPAMVQREYDILAGVVW